MGWVAVFACYRTSAALLAHVPEPIVFLGGRAGWGGVVLLSHTYRSLLVQI
jgi:nitrogen fixation protein